MAVLEGMGEMLPGQLLLIEAGPDTDEEIGGSLARHGYRRYRHDGDRLVAADDGRPLNWFYATDAIVSQLPELFADLVTGSSARR
jgi:hypothetical protein